MKKRLLGIDLIRGIAAYAVIQVHSGDETWGLPIESSAIIFRLLFYFAVPFFLGTSFFFSIHKMTNRISWEFWKSKIERILFPYFVWSLLYFVIRFTSFYLTEESTKLHLLVSDPLALIFLGGTSYQLYFLPLLFTGTLLTLLIKNLSLERISNKSLMFFLVLSLVLYQALIISGNDFRLGFYDSFSNLPALNSLNNNPLIRFILVQVSWLLRCLPYLLLAIVLDRWLSQSNQNLYNIRKLVILVASFLFVNTLKIYIGSNGLADIVVAFLLLLIGIMLSKHIGNNNTVKSLGACSFGVYLIHPIIMNIIEFVEFKLLNSPLKQITIISMLEISIPTFLISWFLVFLLKKKKNLSFFLFGA